MIKKKRREREKCFRGSLRKFAESWTHIGISRDEKRNFTLDWTLKREKYKAHVSCVCMYEFESGKYVLKFLSFPPRRQLYPQNWEVKTSEFREWRCPKYWVDLSHLVELHGVIDTYSRYMYICLIKFTCIFKYIYKKYILKNNWRVNIFKNT